MTILPEPYENEFLAFVFVYARVGAAVFTMPVIGATTVPRHIRAGVAFWISIVLLGSTWGMNESQAGLVLPETIRDYNGLVDFTLAVMSEMAIGFTFGFIGQIFVQTVGVTGEIVGQQGGFSAASVLDPVTGQDIFLMSTIKTLLATLIFIVINGPENVFLVLYESFKVIHPGEGITMGSYSEATYRTIVTTIVNDEGRQYALASMMYRVGVQMAGPMIASMILVSVAEAFLARIVPQMNIMAVGFALRISIALVILLSAMQFTVRAFSDYLEQYMMFSRAMLSRMAPF